MKNTLLKAIVMTMTLTGASAFAQDPELSLICLSTNKADQNIYHMRVFEDQLMGIPEDGPIVEIPENEPKYYTLVTIFGDDSMFQILGNDEFVAKKAATKKQPHAYKFKDLKNKVKYNCEVELEAHALPGIIRVN